MGPESAKASEDQDHAIAGSVERVIFHSPDSGFCVLSIKARAYRHPIVVTGNLNSVGEGEWITATGIWTNNPKFGRQFKTKAITASAPNSLEGVRKYLCSGAIKGIGPVNADKLINAFGEKVFDVIESSPQRLMEVPGLGEYRVNQITDAWNSQRAIREIMVFLHSHGIGPARSARIQKTYGQNAVKVISENPYRLAADIHGIGFKSADSIARHSGIANDAMIRVRSGVLYLLNEAVGRGNCGLSEQELLREASDLLGVGRSRLAEAVDLEIECGSIIRSVLDGQSCLFHERYYRAEQSIADRIRTILSQPMPWDRVASEQTIKRTEREIGIRLGESQVKAVRKALSSKLLVITGGPGVGKTTIVNLILRLLDTMGVAFKLCAPTGRAAKRMKETTGRPSQTLHRLLAFDPVTGRFNHNSRKKLECDFLVVDETSMVDVPLMKALLDAIPDSTALLLVGDVDQLPSVGPGQVLKDIILSSAVPVVRLTEVFRQVGESQIVANAHRINSGVMPDFDNQQVESDFFYVPAENPESALPKILKLVCERIPKRFKMDPVRDVQILSPMIRGTVGTKLLNSELQDALNPATGPSVTRAESTFYRGDRVMQVQNDYEKMVFNGDIGFVTDIDEDGQAMVVDFDGRDVEMEFSELDALVPAYAITVHKSQGSEYPAVVIPLTTHHFPMLQRNLLYTAVTRGKRLVVLVGQRKAVEIAIRSTGGRSRISRLQHLLSSPGRKDPTGHQLLSPRDIA